MREMTMAWSFAVVAIGRTCPLSMQPFNHKGCAMSRKIILLWAWARCHAPPQIIHMVRARNDRSGPLKASGFSAMAMCRRPGRMTASALGMAAAMRSVMSAELP